VKVPTQLCKDIDSVLVWLGFKSRAEYVREKVRLALRRDLLYVENKEEQIRMAKEE